MPFFQIIAEGTARYVYANTLRRVLVHLSSLGEPYQSYDSIEATSDTKLEPMYKRGYSPYKDDSFVVIVKEVSGVPVLNVENGLTETTQLKVPRLPLKSTVWTHFLNK